MFGCGGCLVAIVIFEFYLPVLWIRFQFWKQCHLFRDVNIIVYAREELRTTNKDAAYTSIVGAKSRRRILLGGKIIGLSKSVVACPITLLLIVLSNSSAPSLIAVGSARYGADCGDQKSLLSESIRSFAKLISRRCSVYMLSSFSNISKEAGRWCLNLEGSWTSSLRFSPNIFRLFLDNHMFGHSFRTIWCRLVLHCDLETLTLVTSALERYVKRSSST